MFECLKKFGDLYILGTSKTDLTDLSYPLHDSPIEESLINSAKLKVLRPNKLFVSTFKLKFRHCYIILSRQ